MALLSVEEHKNERGRMRALHILHSASETLRVIVDRKQTTETESGIEEDLHVRTCRTLLVRIKNEAEKLMEPVEQALSEAAPQRHYSKHNGPDDQGVLV